MSPIDNTGAGTFEPRDEREQLLAAFAEVVSERGFEQATVEAIVQRAGVGRDRFDRCFVDLPDCITQALDVFIERALGALARGFFSTPGTWAEAAYGGFDAFFRFCVGSPGFLYALVVELPYGGPPALARRAQLHTLFADFIRPALEGADPDVRPEGDEHVVAQLICGGIWEVFQVYAAEDRIPELLDTLPWVAYASLSPLIGEDEARRVVRQGKARAAAYAGPAQRWQAPAI